MFQALKEEWEEIDTYLIVPNSRAKLFREKYSFSHQRTEAGRYYALYHHDPNWMTLSRNLLTVGETDALQKARPHLQSEKGSFVYVITPFGVVLLIYLPDCS